MRILPVCLLLLAISGCGRQNALRPASAAVAPEIQKVSAASGWLETQLFFGIGPDVSRQDDSHQDAPGQKGMGDARWRTFLDAEVTPRFPDGLTVLDGYGQWWSAGQATPGHERSKVLVIVHHDTFEANSKVEAIRAAWKRLTGDESVLRVSRAVSVSF